MDAFFAAAAAGPVTGLLGAAVGGLGLLFGVDDNETQQAMKDLRDDQRTQFDEMRKVLVELSGNAAQVLDGISGLKDVLSRLPDVIVTQ